MLSLRGLPAFTLRDVNFNGAQRTKFLVNVELGGGAGHAEFSNCVLASIGNVQGACLMVIGNSPTAQQDDGGGSRPRSNLTLTRCCFQPNPPLTGGAFSRDLRAVELNVHDDVNVEFRNCTFGDVADPMIAALRGRFSLNECLLNANRRVQDAQLNTSNGTDVFIHPPMTVNGELEAPASFTCREVESQSFQFLATYSDDAAPFRATSPTRPTGDRSACIFVNLHHNAVVVEGVVGWHRETRPSIFWDGPGRRGSHLIMIGCRCKSDYGSADDRVGPLGVVRLGPNSRGRVYNLGNTTYDWMRAAEMDPRGVIPPDFVLPSSPSMLNNVYQLPAIEVPR